jgi:UDP-N-acetylmuramate: L-alanyl-gamma-D-glutamyl-meso-diaminopimelate ligase
MDLSHQVKPDQIDLLKNVKKVFFYRICGTGMGAAACLLKENGFHVEGGDLNFYPPMSTYLESTGITCKKLEEATDDYLKDFDLIVVGNVVPRMSDDARRIEQLGVPFISFPSALGFLVLAKQNVIGISGTHGKTTTTYFLTQILENLGKNPGYFIGGVIEGRPPSRLGDGSYFVIESDEYDSAYFEKFSKFRSYHIDHLILTSLEFDHADIFESIENIKDEFRALIPNVEGAHIYCENYPAAKELASEFKGKQITWYGANSEEGPSILKVDEKGTTFQLIWNGKKQNFHTNMIGKHNIENISACLFFCLNEGFSAEDLQRAISNLSLVKRRQEIRGTYGKAVIIDDFAHHPRAVEATLEAIRSRYPDKKLKVIFEPHSATARSSFFQEGFENSLAEADEVYITKLPRPTSAKGAVDLDVQKVVVKAKSKGKESKVLSSTDEVIDVVKNAGKEDSVILVLSNGTCLGFWQSDFIHEIQK